MAEREKQYWLHRITGGVNAVKLTHPLLFEHGILSTGWARCSWDDFVKKSIGDWETFLREFGYEYPSLGNYRSLWNFLQMQEGDIVVVPTYGEFSIYRVADNNVYTNESLSSIISIDELIDENGKTAYVDKDKNGYSYLFDADGEFIDLGFFRKVTPIAEYLSRSLCDDTLRNYLGNPRTNININAISTHVDNVINSINFNKHMAHIRLDRTFWPVGHGAFYTERFFNHGDNNVFTAIYDCGGKDQAVVQRIIDQILLRDNHVDYLFISHFHRDHINGLRYLLNKAQVDHIVLPQIEETLLIEAYIYNAITADNPSVANDDAQFFIRRQLDTRDLRAERIIEVEPLIEENNNLEPRREGIKQYVPSGHPIYIPTNNNNPYWIYIPVNIDYDKLKRQKLTTALNKICTDCAEKPIIESGVINWNNIDAILNKKMKEVKDAYKQVFQSHNAYSMPVFSGPVIGTHISWRLYDCDFFDDYAEQYNWYEWKFRRHHLFGKRLLSCLYMGDFEASTPDNLFKLERLLKEYYYVTGLLQVPHHYSKYNHDIDLYEDHILAFGNVNDHKDVSFCHSVYNEISRATYLPPLIITEKDSPKRIEYDMFV